MILMAARLNEWRAAPLPNFLQVQYSLASVGIRSIAFIDRYGLPERPSRDSGPPQWRGRAMLAVTI
jgi:hypothetical protein